MDPQTSARLYGVTSQKKGIFIVSNVLVSVAIVVFTSLDTKVASFLFGLQSLKINAVCGV